MQRRLITVILFSIVAALISSTTLYKVISANSQPSVPSGTAVLVATRDLEAGALVGKSDVRAIAWQAPVSPRWATKSDEIVGRGVLTAINKGEPFPSNRLALKGAGAGLTSRIPPGMRAVSVHVDELNGLNRVIVPGMHVDVISTGSAPGAASQGMMTRTILQNVEVLSTGQDMDHSAKDRPAVEQAVNLLVTPRQAEVLSQAAAQNRIQLVLRNPLDTALALLGIHDDSASAEKKPPKMARAAAEPAKPVVKPEPPAPPRPQPLPTIEVIHGTKKVTATVDFSDNGPVAQETNQ